MELEQFKTHIGKKVSVAIPHRYDVDRFFYHFGILKTVNADSVSVETNKGLVFITQEEIKQIIVEKE